MKLMILKSNSFIFLLKLGKCTISQSGNTASEKQASQATVV